MKTGMITIIDIGSSAVKIVVARKRFSDLEVLKTAYLPAATLTEPELAAQIHSFVFDNALERSPFATCINRNSCLVKFLTLPTLDEEEIGTMLPFELEKHVPQALGEVVTAWRLVRQDPEKNFSEVAVVVIKRDLIDKHLSLLSQAGVTPDLIGFSSLALADGFVRAGQEQGQAVLLQIGAASTEINILVEGKMLFSRSVPVAGNTLNQLWLKETGQEEAEVEVLKKDPDQIKDKKVAGAARDWLRMLGDEIEQSFEAFRSERQQFLQPGIYLSGGGSLWPGLGPYLQERFHAETVLSDPFAGWNMAPGSLPEQGVSFAQAMGLVAEAAKPGDTNINLLPLDLVSAKEKKRKKKLTLMSTALALLVILPVAIIGFSGRIKEKRELAEINRQLAAIKSDLGQAKEMQNKVQLYQDCVKGKEILLESLRQITLAAPSNVFLDYFAFDRMAKTINIRGKTTNHASAAGFAIALDKTAYFDKIINKGSREDKFGDLSLVNFEMDCQLKEGTP